MERLRKACRLSARDWMCLGQAWVLFLAVELGLHLLSFRSLLTLCRWYSQCGQWGSRSASLPPIERVAWLIAVAGRYSPIRATCLKQALVLSVLLERRGKATRLRIGVSRQAEGFKAHAWLEQNGRIILGLPGCDGFEPLFPSREEITTQ